MHACMHACMVAWRHKAGDHNWLWLWLEPIRDSTQSQFVSGGDNARFFEGPLQHAILAGFSYKTL